MTKTYISHKPESVTFVTMQNVTKCHKKTCDWYKLGYVLRFGFGSNTFREMMEGSYRAGSTVRTGRTVELGDRDWGFNACKSIVLLVLFLLFLVVGSFSSAPRCISPNHA